MQAKKSLQNVMEFMFARETCCKVQQNASKERFALRLQNLCFKEKTCCKESQNESEENFARDDMQAKKSFVTRHNRI